jgi:hypothetical protein
VVGSNVNPVPSASKAQENSHQPKSVDAQIAHISLDSPEWIWVACVSILAMTCCSHLRQGRIRERPQWSCIKVKLFLWNSRGMTVFFSRTRKRHAHLFIKKEEKRIQNGSVQEDPHYGGRKQRNKNTSINKRNQKLLWSKDLGLGLLRDLSL